MHSLGSISGESVPIFIPRDEQCFWKVVGVEFPTEPSCGPEHGKDNGFQSYSILLRALMSTIF